MYSAVATRIMSGCGCTKRTWIQDLMYRSVIRSVRKSRLTTAAIRSITY